MQQNCPNYGPNVVPKNRPNIHAERSATHQTLVFGRLLVEFWHAERYFQVKKGKISLVASL